MFSLQGIHFGAQVIQIGCLRQVVKVPAQPAKDGVSCHVHQMR